MFSDTHFHFEQTAKRTSEEKIISGSEILSKMAERNCFFGLDIGTESDDLLRRQAYADSAIAQIKDQKNADRARSFLYFSAGIWPSVEEIKNRKESMKTLKEMVNASFSENENDTLNRKIIAIGEFGLDHHWNPSGVDGRCESDFDQKMYDGERELMKMQLEYAKSLNLPVIIHSRDAFTDTLECIKEVGYNKGIIHCYSYGADEAEKFLESGWYISFSGSVTYTKKNKMEEMEKLLRMIPDDKILCETDAPYLSPVPLRGQINTPVNVEHTYNFIAGIRSTSPEDLSNLVDRNIKKLFNLTI